MTEEEKDILILKILERPQSLTDDETSLILSDDELLDIYSTSLKVKDALRSPLKVDPQKEWELMKTRILASETEKLPSSSSDIEPEAVRRSLLTRFIQNMAKRPAAAAIGGLVVAGAIAIGLLWNPQPIQQDGNYSGIAKNAQNTQNKQTPLEQPTITDVNNIEAAPDNGNDLFVSEEGDVESMQEVISDRDIVHQKTQDQSPKRNITTESHPSYASNGVSSSEPKTNNLSSKSTEQTEEDLTLPNYPANQDLAYTEDGVGEFELEQLDTQWPEDWSIDQCLKLQQARIDNELAMALAQSRKKDYEILRENILLEYWLSNPDSDEATLEEIGAYLDQYYGNLYSAIP